MTVVVVQYEEVIVKVPDVRGRSEVVYLGRVNA